MAQKLSEFSPLWQPLNLNAEGLCTPRRVPLCHCPQARGVFHPRFLARPPGAPKAKGGGSLSGVVPGHRLVDEVLTVAMERACWWPSQVQAGPLPRLASDRLRPWPGNEEGLLALTQ